MSQMDALVAFAQQPHCLPAATQATAIRLVQDTLAVGIAGATAPGAPGIRLTAQTFGTGQDAAVLGTRLMLPAAGAAFANAFQIHCLEWDAVHEPAVVHALSVVTAVVSAIAQRQGDVRDADFLAAIIVGVDVASGLGISSSSGLRFFRPATAGLLGATLAAARIAGLTPAQMRDALGLAHAQISGTMQAHVEGSIALPVQSAVAARAAVTAIDLVRHGITGPHDVFTGPFGYFGLIETAGDLGPYLAAAGQRWLIDAVSIKPFPSGRASHAVLSGLMALQHQHGFSLSTVARVDAELTPLAARLVGRAPTRHMTPAYARLCLPYLAAMMLRDGAIHPHRFASSLEDAELHAAASNVHITISNMADPNALSPQQLRVVLTTGEVWQMPIPHTLGSPENPMTPEQTNAKLKACIDLAQDPLTPGQVASLTDTPIAFAKAGHLP